MFSINKDKFFTILNDINKTCNYINVKDKAFTDVQKFNELLCKVDLNKYACDYVQNRLIIIRPRNLSFHYIKNLIICPFDTVKSLPNDECETFTYNFPKKEKKSYLAPENTPLNESYCIKGYMNPGILNSILLYMINTNLISEDTMIIFSIKSNYSKRDDDDIIEYLQKNNLNYNNNSLDNIINLNYTSENKGYPKKDYIGKFNIESLRPEFSYDVAKKLYELESFEFKQKTNYDININKPPKFKDNYRKIQEYFNCYNYIECRLFAFSEKPINAKYYVLLNNEFLVEWNSIEKFINMLTNLIKRGDK